jgi:hypothetical protein
MVGHSESAQAGGLGGITPGKSQSKNRADGYRLIHMAAEKTLPFDVNQRRGSGWRLAATDTVDLAFARQTDGSQEVWHQRKKIRKPI